MESIQTVMSLPCSQPTYEELKRIMGCAKRAAKYGSQPTYEELKLPRGRSQQPGCHRSQPTYEELKRDILHADDLLHVVLSLPMRN